ncbi:hypothetical protein TNCT_340291 [Trichonephila clavata]|uniref:Uncharacterized protein n=1 Tax=Trichonephila clavata TaxID=2740835 RepID=A0A8X6M215_TRICU|nr:hypothetical protein TNCT_340291 [Trichonephila clavata]
MYNSLSNNVVSLHSTNFIVTDLWSLDAIGITDPTEDAHRKQVYSDFLYQFKENSCSLLDGCQSFVLSHGCCGLWATRRKKREFREIGDLNDHEIEQVEKTLIKVVQAKFFPSENSFPNMNAIADA